MKTKYLLVPFILGLGLALALPWALAVDALFSLPKASVVQAATIEIDSAGVVYASPGRTFGEASPCYESITFVIRYDGKSPSPELMAALADLRAAHRVSAVDINSVPGTILVRGEESVLLALRDAPGVVAVYPADVLPSVAGSPTDFAFFEDDTATFGTPPSRTDNASASPTADGVITGVVTAEDTGLPLRWVNVYAYDADNYSYTGYSASTDASGIFSLGGLSTNNYKLKFSHWEYAFEWYNNAVDWYGANPIAVTDGMTTSISIQLTRGGIITGVVTAEDTGLPLSGISAYAAYEGGGSYWVSTDTSGHYKIGGLAAGAYSVCFKDWDYNYAAECYDNKPYEYGGGDPLAVTAGVTLANINAVLSPAAVIAGRVTDVDTGAGIADVSVSASRQDGSGPSGSATTGADGYYTTSAMSSGVYRVSFDPPAPYFEEHYDNFKSWTTFTPVTVTAPLTTIDINAALSKGYMVTVTVTGAGMPLADIHVRLYRGSASYYSGSPSDYTAGDGTYAVGPLEPGEYRLAFSPSADSPYAPQWYDGSHAYAGSTAITLPHTAPVNAELSYGNRITGVVTGPDSLPISGIYVHIYEAGASSTNLASVSTDENGQYLSSSLAPGAYQVLFNEWAWSGYASQWYDGQPSQADATVITLTAGVTTTNINAQLTALSEQEATGAITGTITAADTGQLLQGVGMCIYEDDPYSPEAMFCGGWAWWDGEFTISGWEAGQYHLYFDAPAPYASVFYKDAYTPENATPITITGNMTTTNINQVLQIGGSITGTVAAAGSGVGVAGAKVEVSLADSIQVMGGPGSWSSFKTRTVYAGVDGAYRMDGLPSGAYDVQFIPLSPYIRQWYGGTPHAALLAGEGSTGTGTPVSVALGTTTPNINAAVMEGGVITGTVTAADTGAPLLGATVTVSSTTGDTSVFAYVDMDGRYTTPGLPAGDYKVQFSGSWDSGYLSEWNGNASSFDTAPSITVPASGAVANVNAVLDKGGSISGFTYNKRTGLPLPYVNVSVYSATVESSTASGYGNGWGFYQVIGLPAGQYKVSFVESGYSTQWYSDATSFDSATSVAVSLSQDTPNINGYLSSFMCNVYLPLVLRSH